MLDHDQEKLLDEATAVVKEQAFYMKRAIDNENLRDALKHASNLICELRTSLLSPRNYYELYMQVFHELQYLEAFFSERNRHNRKMCELYESVQHAGNILPRLYLLITVGSSYIKSKDAPAKDILRDMAELCKGVQHPMRGLFLRYYLTQMCKDKLPDTGSEYEIEGGGTLQDAFDFLLANFTESTRLWSRLQHQGPLRDKTKREKERHDLRVLVGANLVRMSQLEGMTQDYYAHVALPKIIEQIVTCKDTMSQQYLLDCVIQVFSDECHLRTLSQLLDACMQVQPTVDLKSILVNLMNRLASFIQSNSESAPVDVDIFGLLNEHLNELYTRPIINDAQTNNGAANNNANGQAGSMQLSSLLELQVAFLSFTLTLYPTQVEHVDVIMNSTVNLLRNTLTDKNAKLEGGCVESIVELLSSPLRSLSLSILETAHYTNLMKFLNFNTRKQVAISMVGTVLEACTPVNDLQAVERFFEFISPLVKDEDDTPLEEGQGTDDEFVEEQQQVSKLVHLIQHEDTDEMFNMYMAARTCFGQGGERRMSHTLPSLVICALKLVRLITLREQQHRDTPSDVSPPKISLKKVFHFVHTTCVQLVQCAPEVALRLFLLAAVSASTADPVNPSSLEPICYEYLTQALVCYEEHLSDSRSQFQGLILMVGTLVGFTSCLDPENYDTVAAKIAQHGARLLRKPDQCRAILLCSHLFWSNARFRDGQRVLECLQKALKIADVAVQSSPTHVVLFSEILDKYIYYFEQGNYEITIGFIQDLIALCSEHIKYGETDGCKDARRNFMNTINFVKSKMESDPHSRYEGLRLDDIDVIQVN